MRLVVGLVLITSITTSRSHDIDACVRLCIEETLNHRCNVTTGNADSCPCGGDLPSAHLDDVRECVSKRRCKQGDSRQYSAIADDMGRDRGRFRPRDLKLGSSSGTTKTSQVSSRPTTYATLNSSVWTTPTNTLASVPTNNPVDTTIETPSTERKSPSLSITLIVTIVVAVVVFFCILAGVLSWYLRRRRRRKTPIEVKVSATEEKGLDSIVPGHAELSGSQQLVHELDSIAPSKPKSIDITGHTPEIDSKPLPKTPEVPAPQLKRLRWSKSHIAFCLTPEVPQDKPLSIMSDKEAQDVATSVDLDEQKRRNTLELDTLRKRRTELEKERWYLERLKEIEVEDKRLRQRISEIEEQGPS